MSREIKFRGRRLDNGEWVYGYFCLSINGKTLIISAVEYCNHRLWDGENPAEAFEVIPDTVRQFIGIKDKNGNYVYEGDLVSAYDGRIKGPVIFEKRGLTFGIPKCPNEIYKFSMNFLESKDIEVVGNVFDNPELMEVAK